VLGLVYAVPFIVLSLVACVSCLVVPRLRRYALRALVAPVAFGFCSIVSAVTIVVSAAGLGRPIPEIAGVRGALIVIAIYITPGVLGTLLVMALLDRVRRWLASPGESSAGK
jgi:hypothetical protein